MSYHVCFPVFHFSPLTLWNPLALPSSRVGGAISQSFPIGHSAFPLIPVSQALLWPGGSPEIGASSHKSLLPVPAQCNVAGWCSPDRGSGTGVLPAPSRGSQQGGHVVGFPATHHVSPQCTGQSPATRPDQAAREAGKQGLPCVTVSAAFV